MKKLSDYQGAEAIELWADLLEPCMKIMTEPKVKEALGKKPIIEVAQIILKTNAKEAVAMMERVDSTPVNGINALTRLMGFLTDLMTDESTKVFFGSAVQEVKE